MWRKSPQTPVKKAQVAKQMTQSTRLNLIAARPPGESQKTLKKDAEMKMIAKDDDERRKAALMQFMQREFVRLLDTSPQAGQPTGSTAEEDYFQPGYVIADRFTVVQKLHGGAFGQVYATEDETMNKGPVAVKIESLKCPTPLLSLETTVLRSVQDRPHSPMYVSAGRIGEDFNYLAMQLVGPNLDSLRRRCPLDVKRYSVSTAMRLAIQCLEAIRDMQNVGWIHRDIKASNYAIGGSQSTATIVYLLDYGLCREHLVDGKVRPERKKAGFRGTVRYASKATHCMQDLGRKDDIWSLYYTVAEWLSGSLPWSNEADPEIAFQMKKTTSAEALCPNLAEPMIIIGGYLEGLRYADTPDYQLIESTLRRVCEAKAVRFADPFDWQNNFKFVAEGK